MTLFFHLLKLTSLKVFSFSDYYICICSIENIIYFSNVQLLVQWHFFSLTYSDFKRISRNIFESNGPTVYKKNKEDTLVIYLKAWAGNVIVNFRELFCSTKCDFDLYKRAALLREH